MPNVVSVVFNFHKEMVKGFEDKDEIIAAQVMKNMLTHGAEHLHGS
jgi:hypothetical protein